MPPPTLNSEEPDSDAQPLCRSYVINQAFATRYSATAGEEPKLISTQADVNEVLPRKSNGD